MSDQRAIGSDGFAGSPCIVSRKGLDMLKFPRPDVRIHLRNLGHPIYIAGKNGKRLRGKSRPAGRVK